MFPFDENTDPELRNQILLYHLSEVLSDSERARLLNLPEGCRIRERAKILAPQNLVCGKHVWIGEGAILDAQGGLVIGDNTQIGLGVMIWSHSSHKQAVAGETCQNRDNIIYQKTTIGKNCFIAGPTVISPGVTIGDRAVISPLSFIQKDVPNDGVVSRNRDFHKLEKRVRKIELLLEDLTQALAQTGVIPKETSPEDHSEQNE